MSLSHFVACHDCRTCALVGHTGSSGRPNGNEKDVLHLRAFLILHQGHQIAACTEGAEYISDYKEFDDIKEADLPEEARYLLGIDQPPDLLDAYFERYPHLRPGKVTP